MVFVVVVVIVVVVVAVASSWTVRYSVISYLAIFCIV